jgi:hypothetical protein
MLSLHNQYRERHQVPPMKNIKVLNEIDEGNKTESTTQFGICIFELSTSFSPFLFDSSCEGKY